MKRGFVFSFANVFSDRRRTRRFEVLPGFVTSEVFSTTNQKSMGCFITVSGTAATTHKFMNNIRGQEAYQTIDQSVYYLFSQRRSNTLDV